MCNVVLVVWALLNVRFALWHSKVSSCFSSEGADHPTNEKRVCVMSFSQVFGSNLSPLEPDVTEAIEEALPAKSDPA